ncbi:MAG: DNA repair protein radc [Bacteroidetes bacterium]|nr:MAG: DNA repair protein radc [Bacteroidota bacterium]
MSYETKTSIKNWADDDRPREKLMLKGKTSLSDAELIAILIGSGNTEESAVELSRRILHANNDNLVDLSRMSLHELIKFKGIGEAKAISIIAALELGKRRRSAEARERKTITSSKDAFEQMYATTADLDYEKFWVMLLDQANKVIRIAEVSEGGITGTIADPKKIFKVALEGNACNIILCHNHPSGQLKPSEADIKITEKLKRSGEIIDIKVLDHLIIGIDGFFSFADEGIL